MRRTPVADVAVYAPLAAPLYVEGGGHTGGAEIQAYLLAKALADQGFRVRHVVEPGSGEPLRSPDGVEPIVIPLAEGARRAARYRAVAAALATADARVYVQRSAGYETGVVAAWARSHRRRFVFSSSSDADFALDRATALMTGAGMHLRRSVVQYRIGLALADAVVVQTHAQREQARKQFGLDAHVIRSFAKATSSPALPREAFLWIGGIVDVKDPLAYIEVARLVPQAHFWMVATERETGRALANELLEATASVPNLELLAPRPRLDLLELYRRAVAVVSTSRLEGFPNTFLEAWAHGTPSLSLRFDPDGVIAANELGAVAGGSVERLAEQAATLWERRHDDRSSVLRGYVRREHDPGVVGPRWAALVRRLAGVPADDAQR